MCLQEESLQIALNTNINNIITDTQIISRCFYFGGYFERDLKHFQCKGVYKDGLSYYDVQ